MWTAALLKQVLDVVRMRPETLGDAFAQIALVSVALERASPDQRARLRAASTGDAGLLQRRRSRATGTEVSIYDNKVAQIEVGEPDLLYFLVCESHGFCVGVRTLAAARAESSRAASWCEGCAAACAGREGTTDDEPT